MGRITEARANGVAERRALSIFEGDDKAARQAACDELRTIASVPGLSQCTVLVDGLGKELEDEARLTEVFGSGSVLVATVCKGKAEKKQAWVTFVEETEAQHAVANAPALVNEGAEAITRAVGASEDSHEAAHYVRVNRACVELAKACVAPLVHGVLCADASRVDADEARQAYMVLGKLMMLDPLQVGAEWLRNDRWLAAWKSTLASIRCDAKAARECAMVVAVGVHLCRRWGRRLPAGC